MVGNYACGAGVQAHELGHNFGLLHAPGNCEEPEPIDHDFPYDDAEIGPRRGWIGSRDEFATSKEGSTYYDLMGYCTPRFTSDYNYSKMVDYRLDLVPPKLDEVEVRGPKLMFGQVSTVTSTAQHTQSLYDLESDLASSVQSTESSLAARVRPEEFGPSIAITGVVENGGIWSILGVDVSTQAPREPDSGGEYVLTLLDENYLEIYREPMSLLTAAHGEARSIWAVRVPMPVTTRMFVEIVDSIGMTVMTREVVLPTN